MYAAHWRCPQPDSTDWAILSPDVPVFRDDAGTALDAPWTLSILTCAAPYAPALGEQARSIAEVVFGISGWSPERRYLGPFRDLLARDSERGDGNDGSG